MILKKLHLKNIRSYEDLEVSFPRGSVLLAGDIGSGKTSILLGLQFALFGLQPGQKGSSILRQGEMNASAKIIFEINGEEICLERSIKKTKSGSISQEANLLVKNNESFELSTSEMKERVIKILNYPLEFAKRSNLLYKFTVYTPQEEMKEIIEERPEVRLDTLRHIFGIDRYRRIKENSSIFAQKIKDSIRVKEVLISELNLLKEKFAIETEKKIQLVRRKNNIERELSVSVEKLDAANVVVARLQKSLEEKRLIDSQINELNAVIASKREVQTRMNREMVLLQKQAGEVIDFSADALRSVSELLEKHQAVLDEKNDLFLSISSAISVLESKKEAQASLKENVMNLENCPTCFQVVSIDHKHKISKNTGFEIDSINIELDQKLQQREQLVKDLERQKELMRGYLSDKNRLQENKIKFEHHKSLQTKLKSDMFVLERTSNEINELVNRRDVLTNKSSGFESLQEEFENGRRNADDILREVRMREIELATTNKELEILRRQLEELSLEIRSKEKIREHVNQLRSLQDWLQEKFLPMIALTEKNVMMRLRSEFSSIFSQWFSMLVSDQLSVRLDEDFTPVITNQDYELDYEFLSGGERTAIALAYRLSLNQVLNSMLSQIKTKGIVILDEPTDGFSTDQIDKMRDIFEQLKAEQLILVSHEQKIEGFVDHVIRVRKEGSSRVDTSP